MNGEGRIPPLLIAGLVFLVLAIGALAYYAGRFGRSADGPVDDRPMELPPPGPPEPAVAEVIRPPVEVPPTVTPSIGVIIQNETRTSRTRMVQRSSQIDVPVPAVIPTAPFGRQAPTPVPTTVRRIVVEVVTTPVPTPVLDDVEPEEIEEEDPPFPVATPEPTAVRLIRPV